MGTGAGAVPDVVGPHLMVLFCGINPGLRSAEVGQHFARPGNRFWRALHGAGFTERVLRPDEQDQLPALGVGITNLVGRATAGAAELTTAELREGSERLERTVVALAPRAVVFLGLGAYRSAFRRPRAAVGRQPETIGTTAVWVLPNPSGLQARYQLPDLVKLFAEVRASVTAPAPTKTDSGPKRKT